MKAETVFRKRVDLFLKDLENCVDFSIQQVSIRGTPDKILCIQGWFIAAELKADEGMPDQLQAYIQTRIRSQGKGIAFIWRPQNHEAIKTFLSQLNAGVFDRAMLDKINKEENSI